MRVRKKPADKKKAPARGNRALFDEPTQFVAVRLPKSVVEKMDAFLTGGTTQFRDRSDLMRQIVMRAAETDFNFARGDRLVAQLNRVIDAIRSEFRDDDGPRDSKLAEMLQLGIRFEQQKERKSRKKVSSD